MTTSPASEVRSQEHLPTTDVSEPAPASGLASPVGTRRTVDESEPSAARHRRGQASGRTSALRGLAVGSAVGIIGATTAATLTQRLLGHPALDLLLGVSVGVVVLAAGQGIVAASGTVLRALRPPRGGAHRRSRPAWIVAYPAMLSVLVSVQHVLDRPVPRIAGVPALAAVTVAVASMLVGAALHRDRTRRRSVVLLTAALALTVGGAGWLAAPGDGPVAPPLGAAPVPLLALPDPGAQGRYDVTHFSYGSATRGLPAAYAEGAALRTASIDATPLLPAGVRPLLERYVSWRFAGYDELPVNGLVWFPVGRGPFPLVLLVHGNHTMGQASEPGYAYLAEHLASHGLIAVSVDQNQLNGNVLGDAWGEEMPIRAWLLLEHLRWWRRWDADPTTPVGGKVDLDRVAIVGHSRGGEAAVHAAQLNHDPLPPVDRVAMAGEWGFGIRGVVALAPSYGLWEPAGASRTLTGVSYLLVQGAYDADLPPLLGLQQYAQVEVADAPGTFKALAYLQRADHGQFNQVWGRSDIGPLDTALLTRGPLLSGADQRLAAKVLVSGFLSAVLQDAGGYRALFTRPDAARHWLPDDVIVTAYADDTFVPLLPEAAVHDRDGVQIEGADVAMRSPRTSDGASVRDPAIAVRWRTGAAPRIRFPIPPDVELDEGAVLTMRYGSADDPAPPPDLRVTVTSRDGISVTLPLSRTTTVRPPLPSGVLRSERLNRILGAPVPIGNRPTNTVLQIHELPLALFGMGEPALVTRDVVSVELQIGTDAPGTVYLDDVGIRHLGAAELAALGGQPSARAAPRSETPVPRSLRRRRNPAGAWFRGTDDQIRTHRRPIAERIVCQAPRRQPLWISDDGSRWADRQPRHPHSPR
jgi:dienelactone hydrolase